MSWCYLHKGRPGSAGEFCVCGRMETFGSVPPEAPSLWPVIRWLEGGCDPKEAAKELRLYAARLGQAEPHVAGAGENGNG